MQQLTKRRAVVEKRPVRIKDRALSPTSSPMATSPLGPVLEQLAPLEHKVRERERRAADRAAGVPKRVPVKKKIAVELGDPSHDMGEDLGGIAGSSNEETADKPVSERHSSHFMAGGFFE